MKKIYDVLYARSSLGDILIWWMEQDGNRYRTFSGKQSGKITQSNWSVAHPKNIGKKNATSGEEQASLEIESIYNKKIKEKYKRSVDEVDDKTYFNPMLAKKYPEYYGKINFFDGTWIAQIKYNGMRAILSKKGSFSRTGEPILSIPHINEIVNDIFDQKPSCILDGELYNYTLRQKLNELNKLCRKTVDITTQDLALSKEIVQYHVYDMIDIECPQYTFDERYNILRELFINNSRINQYIKLVDNYEIESEEMLNDLYNVVVVGDGQEGLILRKRTALYQQKRTKDLLKLKPEDDAEGKIIKIHQGDGNWSNMCKSFTIEWNGKIFDASLKGTREQAIEIWNNQDQWIGKVVTFLYNGLTGLGVPNFARIDYNNCFKN